jgi:hypothetical protein
MSNSKELASGPQVPATAPQGFDRFIQMAIEKSVPVETLERLLAMQKDIMATNAKAAYDEAMRTFQKACPIIQKHKKVMNKDGRTVRYVYAPLDDIIEQVKVPLAEHGFSYRLGQEVDKPKVGWLTVYCTATHAAGHSETERFELPLGKAEYMTAQQEVGAARTFGSRYCFLGVFGIMTGDEDTDANPPAEDEKKPAAGQPGPAPDKPKPAAPPASEKPASGTGKLTVRGQVVNVEDLPMKKKKPEDVQKYRYKITLAKQSKPFYSFDTKVRDLCHNMALEGDAVIVYHVGQYGQDIDEVSFPDKEFKDLANAPENCQ